MHNLFLLPWAIILEIAPQYDIDPMLVASIILTESSAETCAMRREPTWRYYLNVPKYAKLNKTTKETEATGQSTSWGLMQVMGTVSREHGFDGQLARLCDPVINLRIGCTHLMKKISRYKGDIKKGVAAYNAGSARYKANGEFVNQDYVSTVMNLFESIKKADSAVSIILK